MHPQQKRILKNVTEAIEYLEYAIRCIDAITVDDRTEDTDKLLKSAADQIFEAGETLKKVDTDFYEGRYYKEFSNHTSTVFRHRKNVCSIAPKNNV